jgi:hypothetical protein
MMPRPHARPFLVRPWERVLSDLPRITHLHAKSDGAALDKLQERGEGRKGGLRVLHDRAEFRVPGRLRPSRTPLGAVRSRSSKYEESRLAARELCSLTVSNGAQAQTKKRPKMSSSQIKLSQGSVLRDERSWTLSLSVRPVFLVCVVPPFFSVLSSSIPAWLDGARWTRVNSLHSRPNALDPTTFQRNWTRNNSAGFGGECVCALSRVRSTVHARR